MPFSRHFLFLFLNMIKTSRSKLTRQQTLEDRLHILRLSSVSVCLAHYRAGRCHSVCFPGSGPSIWARTKCTKYKSAETWTSWKKEASKVEQLIHKELGQQQCRSLQLEVLLLCWYQRDGHRNVGMSVPPATDTKSGSPDIFSKAVNPLFCLTPTVHIRLNLSVLVQFYFIF